MARLFDRLRLPLFIVLALWLGFLVEATPGTATYRLTDGSSVTLPRSLEGWHLEPGEGDMLLHGGTRFGTMELEIEKTHVPVGANLSAYIAERHTKLFAANDDYQIRLKGELKPFGPNQLPTSHAVYNGKFLGLFTTRYAQHDVYLPYKWSYVRVGLYYPEFLDDYMTPDTLFLANNLKLAP